MLTKYIKSVLWGLVVRLSYVQDAWCLKVNKAETPKYKDEKESKGGPAYAIVLNRGELCPSHLGCFTFGKEPL